MEERVKNIPNGIAYILRVKNKRSQVLNRCLNRLNGLIIILILTEEFKQEYVFLL